MGGAQTLRKPYEIITDDLNYTTSYATVTCWGDETPNHFHVAQRRAATWPKEAAVHMRTNSYASILGAVASVLDLADARSFAVRDAQHGLTLDLVDGRGERHAIDLTLAEVSDLVAWSETRAADVSNGLSNTGGRDEGSLREFLARHERRALVGAR